MTNEAIKPKRKKYSPELKAYLVEKALQNEHSIASIARDNGINQNLLHKWIQKERAKQPPPATIDQPSFIPIILEENPPIKQANPQATVIATGQSITNLTIKDIKLQISSQTAPINLHITTIDTQTLIELLRGLQ